MKKLIIFDIDGTLYQAHLVSFPAYKVLAKEMGFKEPSEETIRTFFGETFEFVGDTLGLPKDPAVRSHFERRIEEIEYGFVKEYGALFDGIYEQLKRLYDEGYLLALCSMGVKSYVEGIMDCTGIGTFITAYRFDNGVDKKSKMCADILAEVPNDKAIFVGDRKHDLQAARDNRLDFVGCSYGFAPHEIIEAERIAKTPDELYGKLIEAFA